MSFFYSTRFLMGLYFLQNVAIFDNICTAMSFKPTTKFQLVKNLFCHNYIEFIFITFRTFIEIYFLFQIYNLSLIIIYYCYEFMLTKLKRK